MDSPLTAAAFQMATGFDVQENARKIQDAVANAAGCGADLLVVPECALSGYLPSKDLDFGVLEEAEQRLAGAAAEAGIYLALGTTRPGDGLWRNTALLYSPEGRQIARYDKTHGTGGDNAVSRPATSCPYSRSASGRSGCRYASTCASRRTGASCAGAARSW